MGEKLLKNKVTGSADSASSVNVTDSLAVLLGQAPQPHQADQHVNPNTPVVGMVANAQRQDYKHHYSQQQQQQSNVTGMGCGRAVSIGSDVNAI